MIFPPGYFKTFLSQGWIQIFKREGTPFIETLRRKVDRPQKYFFSFLWASVCLKIRWDPPPPLLRPLPYKIRNVFLKAYLYNSVQLLSSVPQVIFFLAQLPLQLFLLSLDHFHFVSKFVGSFPSPLCSFSWLSPGKYLQKD